MVACVPLCCHCAYGGAAVGSAWRAAWGLCAPRCVIDVSNRRPTGRPMRRRWRRSVDGPRSGPLYITCTAIFFSLSLRH
eukprot:3120535-Prymnesium_polylepis.1